MTLGLGLYRAATALAGPGLGLALRRRVSAGKEDPDRLNERQARRLPARPAGRLAWLHGASVGESGVLLTLAKELQTRTPDLSFLMTSQTATSADQVARALPERSLHQMAPLDTPGGAARFISAWRPDLCVFAEGEIWPNLILEAKRSGAKLALVNARMSQSSLDGWNRWPATARRVFGAFDTIIASDQATASGLKRFTTRTIETPGNLKASARPLVADPDLVRSTRSAFGDGQIVLAASTHPGEEELVLHAYSEMRRTRNELSLIIAPRHPERGPALSALAADRGFEAERRSAGAHPTLGRVYIADTIGEMGLWYRVADAIYLGGGHAPGIGGHNPMEPLQLGQPIVSGPQVENFEDVFAALDSVGGAAFACDADDLSKGLSAILDGDAKRPDETALAKLAAAPLQTTLNALIDLLEPIK